MKECNNFMLGLMTLKELSKELQKPESTIRTWRRRGDLPPSLFKEIGGTVFVRVEKLKEWIDNEP